MKGMRPNMHAPCMCLLLWCVAACSEDGSMPHIYFKREDLNHTGAHKINNALGQALLCKRMGKTRIIAETGAGQHGVATVRSTAGSQQQQQQAAARDSDSCRFCEKQQEELQRRAGYLCSCSQHSSCRPKIRSTVLHDDASSSSCWLRACTST